MKYLKLSLITVLVIALYCGTAGSKQVFADDDFDEHYEMHEKHHEENELYEELGKSIGWGTFITLCIGGAIFPIRRLTKTVTTNFPRYKQLYILIAKLLGRYHIFLGIFAFILSIFHGVTLYLSEGELEAEGIIGLGTVIFMVISGVIGSFLFKNKKTKSLRTTHTTFTTIALFIGLIHVLFS